MKLDQFIELLQEEMKTNSNADVRIKLPSFIQLCENMDVDERCIVPVELASNYHTITIHCQ